MKLGGWIVRPKIFPLMSQGDVITAYDVRISSRFPNGGHLGFASCWFSRFLNQNFRKPPKLSKKSLKSIQEYQKDIKT